MQFKRLFSTTNIKNTYGYIDSQKKYELIRTVLYFGISIALYVLGYVTTKTNANLLTVVAVLGCLPASKSLVSMIMFFRYHSCSETIFHSLSKASEHIQHQLYDLVFTSEQATFVFSHCVCQNGSLVFFTERELDSAAFTKHLELYLSRAEIEGVEVLIHKDIDKYLEELASLTSQEETMEHNSILVIQLLKEISL